MKETVRDVRNYKIIFIDYNMPHMMGTEVASKINKLCTDAQVELPKIFCCSAEELTSEFKKSVTDAGMKGTLSKPIEYETLK